MFRYMAEISTTGVFSIAAVSNIEPGPFPDWLQYGAFGLCCLMVLYLLWYLTEMGKIIREKDKNFIDLLEKDIKSRTRLTQALEDRPCLQDDQRLKNGG